MLDFPDVPTLESDLGRVAQDLSQLLPDGLMPGTLKRAASTVAVGRPGYKRRGLGRARDHLCAVSDVHGWRVGVWRMTVSIQTSTPMGHSAHKTGTLSPREQGVLRDMEEHFSTSGADTARPTTANHAIMIVPCHKPKRQRR